MDEQASPSDGHGQKSRGSWSVGAAVGIYGLLGVLLLGTYSTQQVVIWPPLAVREAVTTVLPEGWSFFTKSPTGTTAIPVSEAHEAPRATSDPAALASVSGSGLSRERRNTLIQYELIERALAEASDRVTPCDRSAQRCSPDERLDRVLVGNPLGAPTICGDQDVAIYEPTPWHWIGLVEHRFQLVGTARVKVVCSESASSETRIGMGRCTSSHRRGPAAHTPDEHASADPIPRSRTTAVRRLGQSATSLHSGQRRV